MFSCFSVHITHRWMGISIIIEQNVVTLLDSVPILMLLFYESALYDPNTKYKRVHENCNLLCGFDNMKTKTFLVQLDSNLEKLFSGGQHS